ncbi:MAG: hypothetical protein EZS26_001538 [Candidatus Ordinivivax streblomastigis]|jgi:transposase-like protein|uniref:Uncharacterized protein n=1 Tax=Candidatus Ordinivivax streblomastigis TaxID=2540710 RepID=A0A5M8P1A9_9BACT|nr:MAG: hypothetical protein EZS26_001538 [Candidatus Ordinivivax streblomastigis]MDR2843105.1 hypothetical protein [Candidatus Symbiothrix sp.]
MKTEETTKKTVSIGKTTKQTKEVVYARDRIKPRGLWGCMKGKIHYDKNADIFNLGL